MNVRTLFLTLVLVCFTQVQADQPIYQGHALAMHGDIKYGPDFSHFDYVNPNAPKDGKLTLSATGTFDSLNPFTLKGVSASGLGSTYNLLLANSGDEAFTEYGELVETIEMPTDRSWVAFTLRKEARWHDGKPITVDDVVFSFDTMTTKGHPYYRSYYANVNSPEIIGERTVKFTFKDETNLELPLIVGQLTIIPKHYWQDKDFEETTLEIPLGSGPYKIEAVDPGRSITYRRVEDYWGKDLPVHKGMYNFDVIQYDYYRDATVAIEALKAGEYDWRFENISKEWATAYDIPASKEGRLVKNLIGHERGTGMQGFVFNTRRSKFADPKVRLGLTYAFDFEWTNAKIFYGQYERTTSYFSNTELASSGLAEGDELDLLETYRGRIPKEVFTKVYEPPSTDGSGNIRQNLRTARTLLEEAGWKIKDGKLTHEKTGEVMTIEFLLRSPSFERVVGPYVQNLKRLGVDATIRTVDSAQYQNRLQEYDFDTTVISRGQSLSPGNEQRNYWTTKVADESGGGNYAGIKDPVVDELVQQLINASDRKSLVTITRALDRVLLWGHYVVPHWHIRSYRLVYWNKFGKPDIQAKYTLGFPNTWWIDQEKLAKLNEGQ